MLAYMGNRSPRTLPQSFYLMSHGAYLSELYTCLRTCSWSIRPTVSRVSSFNALLQLCRSHRKTGRGRPKTWLSSGHVDNGMDQPSGSLSGGQSIRLDPSTMC